MMKTLCIVIALCLFLVSTVSATECVPSVTSFPSTHHPNATLYVVVGCGFSSPSFPFVVGPFRLEIVSFDAKPFLLGPLLVSKGDASSEQSVPFHAPQGSGVFAPGTYYVSLRNFGGSTDAWFVNVTVTEALYGPYTSGEPSEPSNNTPQRAARLFPNGELKRGQVFPTFDVDWYTFSLFEDRVVQVLGSTRFGNNTLVGATFSIYNEEGLSSNTALISSSPFLQQDYALQPGKYFISVKTDIPLTTPVNYDISVAPSHLSCALDHSLCFA